MNGTIRTIVLFAMLSLLFILVGLIIGYFVGNVYDMMLLFLIFSLAMNIFAYFASAKMVLWSYKAKIIKENDNPTLFDTVRKVAVQANIPMPQVAIVPTEVPNAFATGRNKKHAIVAVTDGLLKTLNNDELEGVIGHEMGHIRNKDMLLMTAAATIVGALTFLARVYFFEGMFGGGGGNKRGSTWIVIIILALAAIGAVLIQLAISRQREFKADLMSSKLTAKPLALASALRKIEASVSRKPLTRGNPSTASLFIINPFSKNKFANMLSTHPSTPKRIQKLIEYSNNPQ